MYYDVYFILQSQHFRNNVVTNTFFLLPTYLHI